MGYLLTLLYTTLVYLSVADLFPALAPYRISLILAILAALNSIPAMSTQRDYFRMPEFFLVLGLTGAIIFSLLMVLWFGGMVIAVQKVLPAFAAYYLFSANCTSLARVRWSLHVMMAVAAYIILRGAHAYYTIGPPHPFLFEQKFYSEGNMIGDIITLIRIRGLGILNDPNDLAQYIIMLIPALWLFWRKRAHLRNAVFILLPLAWMSFGLFLTRSRGSLVGLVIVSAAYLYRRFGKVASLMGPTAIVFSLLALGFSGGRAFSYSGGMDRVMLWSDGLGMFLRSPLWGVSFGSYRDNAGGHTAHNSFVLCFAELGLIGYFFYVGLVVLAIMRANDQANDTRMPQEYIQTASILRYIVIAFVTTSWFLTRTYETTLYILCGLVAAMEMIRRNHLMLVANDVWILPAKWMKYTLTVMFGSIVMVYFSIKMKALGF